MQFLAFILRSHDIPTMHSIGHQTTTYDQGIKAQLKMHMPAVKTQNEVSSLNSSHHARPQKVQ
jgi:hypothetical protein